jgi:hypothetical protein
MILVRSDDPGSLFNQDLEFRSVTRLPRKLFNLVEEHL